MKKSVTAIGILLIAATFSLAQKTKPEDELRTVYKKLDEATKACSVEKITQYYDTGYSLESDGKKMTRAEAIDQWKSICGFIKSVDKLETKLEKITLTDGKYSVDYTQSSSGKVQFPDSPVLPFTYESKVTDTWTRDVKGVWKTTASVEHMSDFKVNGESAKPPNN